MKIKMKVPPFFLSICHSFIIKSVFHLILAVLLLYPTIFLKLSTKDGIDAYINSLSDWKSLLQIVRAPAKNSYAFSGVFVICRIHHGRCCPYNTIFSLYSNTTNIQESGRHSF